MGDGGPGLNVSGAAGDTPPHGVHVAHCAVHRRTRAKRQSLAKGVQRFLFVERAGLPGSLPALRVTLHTNISYYSAREDGLGCSDHGGSCTATCGPQGTPSEDVPTPPLCRVPLGDSAAHPSFNSQLEDEDGAETTVGVQAEAA